LSTHGQINTGLTGDSRFARLKYRDYLALPYGIACAVAASAVVSLSLTSSATATNRPEGERHAHGQRQGATQSTVASGGIDPARVRHRRTRHTARRPGGRARTVANAALPHADQPGASRARSHWRGADRVRVRQRR